jgi:hypothetical protein
MLIDTEHLHHWMQAIRQSSNPVRTMDAFWSGQLKSKEWLIQALSLCCPIKSGPYTIDIHGGWVGVLASMLFQSTLPIANIRSIDKDPTCRDIAILMNKIEEMEGRFEAITSDMCLVSSQASIIINTSCEHITQEEYDLWLNGHTTNSILVLQSNNYDIPEHIRIANSLDEFKKQSHLDILYADELSLPLYTRWMIIGKKNVQI